MTALATLGCEIEAVHQAAHRDARSALEHAIRCGQLLLEAKQNVEHGGWLRWLAEHTTITPRQSQRYMRLAEHREELAAKSDTGTHLTLRAALDALAEPRSPSPEEDLWGWATWQLEGPFGNWDLEHVDCGWLTTKLMHHLHFDPLVAMLVYLASEYRAIPALRLAPLDQLVDAIELVVPYVKADSDAPALPLASHLSVRALDAAAFVLKFTAQYVLGLLLRELEYRRDKTPDELLREWDTVKAKLSRRIDKELERVKARELSEAKA